MKTIVFIIPWIGKLPNYFTLWLKSCEYNRTVDFLIFTDDKSEYDYPENVKVIYTSMEKLRQLFQKNYSFKICLDRPYKFCDFRPAYGEIFREYIKGYDFWGHCDIDLIWGNIRKFVTDDVLKNNVRVFSRGHCSIYRNSDEVNALYRTLASKGCQDWRTVFRSDKSCCFDEWAGHCGGGMSQIMVNNGVQIFDKICYADIYVGKGYFRINGYEDLKKYIDINFCFDKGRLTIQSDICEIKEILYVHFQKRYIEIDGKYSEKFYLVAPNHITNEIYKDYVGEVKYELNYYKNKIKRKLIDNKL